MDALDNLQNISVPSSASEHRKQGASGSSVAYKNSVSPNFSLNSPSHKTRSYEQNYYHNNKYTMLSQLNKEINL